MPRNEFEQYRFRGLLWVAEAYLRMLWVLASLKIGGFKWLRPRIELNSANATTFMARIEDCKVLALHEAVRLASRLQFFSAECLPKSLVLKGMLNARRFDARVVLGVAKTETGIASHAWVELNDGGEQKMVGEPESVSQEFVKV